MGKLTQKEVVAQFEAINQQNGTAYTFNNIVYTGANIKVLVTCHKENHGDFKITKGNFKRGQGCPKCGGTKSIESRRLTTDLVIKEFEEIESVKKRGYTFKNVIYTQSNQHVLITCNVDNHGDFCITPNSFKSGCGCPKCGLISRSNKRLLSHELVIKQFEKIEEQYKRGYTFKNMCYKDSYTKVSITCPVHGDFKMLPGHFKIGNGCRECANEKNSIQNSFSQEEVIKQFEEIESVKKRGYTFKNVVYKNSHTKVLITCNVDNHGDFSMTPFDFKHGYGCSKCAGNKKHTHEEIVSKLQKIEDYYKRGYTFYNVKYVNINTKVLITCPYHEDFLASPAQFMKGHGCPTCAKGGFKKDKPGIFYYVRVNKDGCEAYKPGITNHSVKKRYPKDFEFMTVLKTIEFESGQEAYDFEQSVLNDYSYAKWNGIPLLRDNGNTELMKYDILGWDN